MMKKLLFIGLVLMGLSAGAFAQNVTDYFAGDWDVVVIGTPNGDAKMIMHLERVEGKLKGEIKGQESSDVIKIDSIEEKENKLIVYYFAGGYDISMDFEKVDENNMDGSLLGMFTTKGSRIIKEKEE
jgi:hypothetical protein